MRRLALVVTLFVAVAGPLRAEPDPQAIQGIISSQIEAFLAEDADAAFAFAAPNIKRRFGTPEVFGRMVRQGYPMVWAPEDLRYLELRRIAGTWYQKVLITDDDGALHVLDYAMTETADGWRIAGVQILPAPEVGV